MHLGSGAIGTLGPDEGRAAPSVGSVGRALFFGEEGDGCKPSFLGGGLCSLCLVLGAWLADLWLWCRSEVSVDSVRSVGSSLFLGRGVMAGSHHSLPR